jgi:ubiquinone/menaquinone biosynthesis C-methylase UbiE
MELDLEGEETFGKATSWLYAKLLGPAANRIFYKFVISDIMKGRARSILDVGTGPGIVPAELAAKNPELAVYAVDPSPYMLGHARKRTRGRVRLAIGYSLSVPFRRKFDMIISSASFHHWAHKKESLIYLARLLNKDGEIRIYEFSKHGILPFGSHAMSAEQLRSAAEGTGLRVKGIITSKGRVRAIYSKS